MPEWMRFVAVNAIGLAVDLGTAIALRFLGVNIFISATAGFTVAALINYRLHAKWTFRSGTVLTGSRFTAFYLAAIATILVRLAALRGLMAVEIPVIFSRDIELLALSTVFSIIVNYGICKRLIFAR